MTDRRRLARACQFQGLPWLALAALALGGCQAEEPGLPVIDPAPTAAATGLAQPGAGFAALADQASDMLACLQEAGLPAVYGPTHQGRSALVVFDDKVPALWISREGETESTTELRGIDTSELPTWGQKPSLWINGADQTELWVGCLDATGYDQDRVYRELYESKDMVRLGQMQVVEASNEWARCAREQGYPGLSDTGLAIGQEYAPPILLPRTIAEDQLRALLAACPVFDPELERSNQELASEWIPGSPLPEAGKPQPNVAIDTSDLETAELSFEERTAIYDHVAKLTGILHEEANNYYG
ncbi:MAG: hypothetical protein LBI84_05175 [Propionibacteriaceae bacterium]|jgi:hypothetical protein|nr:hypothetical protein [Propionibacteriaceae bacterium]